MSLLPIPTTAPFSEDEIAILNRVIAPATPMQRTWLAGFLTGLDVAHGDEGWRVLFRVNDPFRFSRLSRRTAPLPFVP